jgi:hypothetical protein
LNRNVSWGTGALLAIAAVLGISTRTPKGPVASTPSASETKKNVPPKSRESAISTSVCVDPEKLLQEFLLADEADVAAPDSCYSEKFLQDGDAQKSRFASQQRLQTLASHLDFVVAILPDPLHTHLSLQFDRKIEAVQQAAQDAGYDYDSSWLPWQTEEQTFTHLTDQDAIDDRKDAREDQPGLILFRRRSDKPGYPFESAEEPFQRGLAVFVVGEEATRGVHRRQFENAAAWIATLQPHIGICVPIAILGPTFSGSLPSFAELMANKDVQRSLNYTSVFHMPDRQVRVYSGSISGKEAAEAFGGTTVSDPSLSGWNIHFHSFVESDDRVLNDYCDYLSREGLHADRVAFISEDETAYGIGGLQKPSATEEVKKEQEPGKSLVQNQRANDKVPCAGAVRLFYPRDISALRAAYQAQSIFSSPNAQESDTQRKSLSTDLADPAGEAHDTVRSYGGNQTPLAQEAQLLGIVSVLRDHRSEYLIIRSSNTLDQLFLANFFRRVYPEGRIVIRGADTVFLRERGGTGISGVMMLSTYPLIPWDWRDWLDQSDHPTHRVFGEETVEGTYVAARFLIQEAFKSDNRIPKPLDSDWPVCSTEHPERCFVPPNHYPDFSIPDYKAPFWAVPKDCQVTNENVKPTAQCEPYFRPATWFSVLGRGDFYPLAAFNRKGEPDKSNTTDPDKSNKTEYTQEPPVPISEWPPENLNRKRPTNRGWLDVPLGMKVCLLVILAFSAFHLWCCWTASFTAKPAFRAHFAATPIWFAYGQWQHPALVTIGSVVIAFIALASAWGCGAFCNAGLSLAHRLWIWLFLSVGLLAALGAVVANQQAMYRLKTFDPKQPEQPDRRRYFILDWKSQSLKRSVAGFLIATGIFSALIASFEIALDFQNRLLTYWRSMNLNSGVSPLVPLLVLFGGIYMWFWYSLHGLALFGIDRPQLPGENSLFVKDEAGNILKGKDKKALPFLRMFSQERAEPTERKAVPLGRPTRVAASVILITLAVVAFGTAGGAPLRSLGANVYAIVFLFLFALCVSWMLSEAWQLLRVWCGLKQLLSFLDRIALRRTMSALQGFSWGNVWRMSGNVLDVRYKLLSRQIETLNHLKASFEEFEKGAREPNQGDNYRAMASCHEEIKNAQVAMMDFSPVYAASYDKDDFAHFGCLQTFQVSMAGLVGKLITEVLIPAWRKETGSLMKDEVKDSDVTKAGSEAVIAHLPEHIRNAEELVCITYLGFAQNILGRIRTMALGIVWLFVAITVSVSTYPFDPRPTLNKTLVFLFIAVGATVTFVYAEMYRDSTLSRVTNTTPGELGTEFWFKIIGFGVGPLIGLLAYIFPGITDVLFSWFQSGMTLQ